MPTYAYKCCECSHKFDAFQSIQASPLEKCPICQEHSLQRIPCGGVFQLQGEGWYATRCSSGETSATSCCHSSECSHHS